MKLSRQIPLFQMVFVILSFIGGLTNDPVYLSVLIALNLCWLPILFRDRMHTPPPDVQAAWKRLEPETYAAWQREYRTVRFMHGALIATVAICIPLYVYLLIVTRLKE